MDCSVLNFTGLPLTRWPHIQYKNTYLITTLKILNLKQTFFTHVVCFLYAFLPTTVYHLYPCMRSTCSKPLVLSGIITLTISAAVYKLQNSVLV
jgi:hypothetical protein